MTFVKIDSKESELSTIRQYALSKSYIRDRNRSEKLNDFSIHEQAPTPPSKKGNDKNVRQKTENKNNVSNNSTLGGSISTSMPNNYLKGTNFREN